MRKGLITTNDQKPNPPTELAEPKKLDIRTTAIIPEAPKDQPEPKGSDLGKIITTHDIGDEVILREVPKNNIEVKLNEPVELAEPKKKAGRPKKEK